MSDRDQSITPGAGSTRYGGPPVPPAPPWMMAPPPPRPPTIPSPTAPQQLQQVPYGIPHHMMISPPPLGPLPGPAMPQYPHHPRHHPYHPPHPHPHYPVPQYPPRPLMAPFIPQSRSPLVSVSPPSTTSAASAVSPSDGPQVVPAGNQPFVYINCTPAEFNARDLTCRRWRHQQRQAQCAELCNPQNQTSSGVYRVLP